MTCKDCVHEKVCKNAYLFKVTPPNVCSFFKNKADVVEVKHGEWVDNEIEDSILSKCSVCGFSCGAYTFNYCPNCGAKMDGGGNE